MDKFRTIVAGSLLALATAVITAIGAVFPLNTPDAGLVGYSGNVASPYYISGSPATTTEYFGSILPQVDNSYNLGSATQRWANLFSTTVSSTEFLADDGTASAPSYSFSADTDTGLYRSAADTLGIALGGTAGLTLSKSGETLVFTSAPTFKTGIITAYRFTTSVAADGGNDIVASFGHLGAPDLNVFYASGQFKTSAIGVGSAAASTLNASNPFRVTQAAGSGGTPQMVVWATGAMSSMTASTEAIQIHYNLSSTKTWATGNITTQREFLIQAPTYAFAGASTITDAFTQYITGGPIAGTNATITRSWGLGVGGKTLLSLAGTATNIGNSNVPLTVISNDNSGQAVVQFQNTISSGYTAFDMFDNSNVKQGSVVWSNSGTGVFPSSFWLGHRTTAGHTRFVAITTSIADYNDSGDWSFTPAAATSGSQTYFKITSPASTGQTASTEAIGIDFDIDATRTWATGALTRQREVVFRQPTYAFAGASTLQQAATVDIMGAPIAGSNATFTYASALNIAEFDSYASGAGSAGASIIINPVKIANGIGNVGNIVDLYLTASQGNVSLGNQTATLDFLNRIRVEQDTFESTTNVRTVDTAASLYIEGAPIAGTNVTFTNGSHALLVDGGRSTFNGRVLKKQGADVASAGDLTLGDDGNAFEVTGTTTVNAITTTSWQNGSTVTLLFTGSLTVSHNTAGGAGTAPILLSGAANFSATAGDTLTLILSEIGGVQAWREVARTAI